MKRQNTSSSIDGYELNSAEYLWCEVRMFSLAELNPFNPWTYFSDFSEPRSWCMKNIILPHPNRNTLIEHAYHVFFCSASLGLNHFRKGERTWEDMFTEEEIRKFQEESGGSKSIPLAMAFVSLKKIRGRYVLVVELLQEIFKGRNFDLLLLEMLHGHYESLVWKEWLAKTLPFCENPPELQGGLFVTSSANNTPDFEATLKRWVRKDRDFQITMRSLLLPTQTVSDFAESLEIDWSPDLARVIDRELATQDEPYEGSCVFNHVSVDVFQHIFSFIPEIEVNKCRLVCKKWDQVIKSRSLGLCLEWDNFQRFQAIPAEEAWRLLGVCREADAQDVGILIHSYMLHAHRLQHGPAARLHSGDILFELDGTKSDEMRSVFFETFRYYTDASGEAYIVFFDTHDVKERQIQGFIDLAKRCKYVATITVGHIASFIGSYNPPEARHDIHRGNILFLKVPILK